MVITKEISHQVEITDQDMVQVRTKTTFLEDGVEVSSSFHRHVLAPGESASAEAGKVRRIVQVAHVPTVVSRYNAMETKRQAEADRDIAIQARRADDNAATQAAEAAAIQALTDAGSALVAAQAAHDAFLMAE